MDVDNQRTHDIPPGFLGAVGHLTVKHGSGRSPPLFIRNHLAIAILRYFYQIKVPKGMQHENQTCETGWIGEATWFHPALTRAVCHAFLRRQNLDSWTVIFPVNAFYPCNQSHSISVSHDSPSNQINCLCLHCVYILRILFFCLCVCVCVCLLSHPSCP